jgi:kinetochore protein Mis12/MTW1
VLTPVSPLPETATAISQALLALHTQLSPLEPHRPNPDQPLPQGTKAWEMGRQAYLNWAMSKDLPGSTVSGTQGASGGGDETIEGVEREMRAAGGFEGMDRLGEVV